jgi:hypothetical protein
MIDALSRAAREALLFDKQLGVPVPIWRDGRTEWVPTEAIDSLLVQLDGAPSSPRAPDVPAGA